MLFIIVISSLWIVILPQFSFVHFFFFKLLLLLLLLLTVRLFVNGKVQTPRRL